MTASGRKRSFDAIGSGASAIGGKRTFVLYDERMSLPPRIILHSPIADHAALAEFVERCLRDGVRLISIAGDDAEKVEIEIDWLVIGDGSNEGRFLVTAAHPGEPLDEVREFASSWVCDREGLLEVRL